MKKYNLLIEITRLFQLIFVIFFQQHIGLRTLENSHLSTIPMQDGFSQRFIIENSADIRNNIRKNQEQQKESPIQKELIVR